MNFSTKNTLFVGKVAIHLSRVDSTNEYAKRLISKSNPIEGTVIYASQQYAGRGQIGRRWHAQEAKNLTVSFIFKPNFLLAKSQFLLSQAVALALYDLLLHYNFSTTAVKIKWPNDLYIRNRKIAGILIENTLRGMYIDYSVIGIGLNVNQSEFSRELKNPTSFLIERDKKFDLQKMFSQLCIALERWYLRLRARKEALIRQSYVKSMYLLNQKHLFTVVENRETIEGIIRGVAQNGLLRLETGKGIEEIDLKTIIF